MQKFVSVTLVLLFAAPALAQVPKGYPASYQKTIDEARKEKKLVVYSSTDQASAQFLIDDFRALYPFIEVEYNDIGTTQLYSRFISEAAAGGKSADFVWSSGMELQVKLAADGYALPYTSPEAKFYPASSKLDNILYGTTMEPGVLVYNKRFVKKPPTTRQEFAKLLADPKMNGKVATWDPEKSGIGFTFLHQDSVTVGSIMDLFKAFGKSGTAQYSSSGVMMEKVISGEHHFGYNVIGSYALLRAEKVPDIGVAFFKDKTVAFQRPAFISKLGEHPNAAKLFLDYLLSTRGQNVMANKSLIYALRSGTTGPAVPKNIYGKIGGKQNLYVIPVSRDLLKNLEPAVRNDFLNDWRTALKGQ